MIKSFKYNIGDLMECVEASNDICLIIKRYVLHDHMNLYELKSAKFNTTYYIPEYIIDRHYIKK